MTTNPKSPEAIAEELAIAKQAFELIIEAYGDERPYKGFWRLRKWLEAHGTYCDDLSDERGVLEVCKVALSAIRGVEP